MRLEKKLIYKGYKQLKQQSVKWIHDEDTRVLLVVDNRGQAVGFDMYRETMRGKDSGKNLASKSELKQREVNERIFLRSAWDPKFLLPNGSR